MAGVLFEPDRDMAENLDEIDGELEEVAALNDELRQLDADDDAADALADKLTEAAERCEAIAGAFRAMLAAEVMPAECDDAEPEADDDADD